MADSPSIHNLLVILPVGAALLAPDGAFVQANEALCQMLGYTGAEFRHKKLADIFHSEDGANTVLGFMDVRQSGAPQESTELRLQHKNGHFIWGKLSVSPVSDDSDDRVMFVEDITSEKETEASLWQHLLKSELLLQSALDGFCLLDLHGMILEVNPMFAQMTGYSDVELLSMTLADLEVDPDKPQLTPSLAEPDRIDGIHFEARCRCRDGSIAILDVRLRQIELEGETLFFLFAHDITASKSVQQRYYDLFEDVPVALWEEDFSGVKVIVDRLLADGVQDIEAYLLANPDVHAACAAAIQVLNVNRQAMVLYGVTDKDSMLGSLEQFYDVSGNFTLPEEIQVFTNGAPRHTTELVRHQVDGSTIYMRLNASIVRGYEEDWGRVIVSLTDVTQLVQMEAAEREQRALAESLSEITALITRSLDPDETLNHILDNVGRVVPHDASNIGLIADEYVYFHYSRNYEQYHAPGFKDVKLSLDVESYRWMVDTGRPCLIADTHQITQFTWQAGDHAEWIRSYVGAPIRIHDEVIGFLNLDSETPNFFTQVHAERLMAFANQVAIALENAQLYDATRRHADELKLNVQQRTQELEYERAQLQAILEGMGEGVIYLEGGKVRYINQQIGQLLGYVDVDFQECLDKIIKGVRDHNASGDMTLDEEIAQSLVANDIWKGELLLPHKDGHYFPAGLTITQVKGASGESVAQVILVRDISQERKLQETKDRFIANASHELRTPIANLKMRLYLLEKQPERATVHMDVLKTVATQMTELVEDLLDLSRYERGIVQINREPVVLNELVSISVQMQQSLADSQGLTLAMLLPDDEIIVPIDQARIGQVLTNLIANAINYTPPHGEIVVHLKRTPYAAQIDVLDTGIGIANEVVDRIFEPFYRVSEQSGVGTGLGLSIAQEIMELHGGDLTVESSEDHGSTFTILLPFE